MTLCGINFNLYFVLARRGFKKMMQDSELRFYLMIIAVITSLLVLNLMMTGTYESLSDCIRDSAFQVSSIMTTTGFATADYDIWPTFSKMLIFILLLMGACSSSTGGGIKLIRILVALKLVRRGISLKLHPKQSCYRHLKQA